jgi:very-short-patch-repair endonuclease
MPIKQWLLNKKHKCLDCDKLIGYRATRCRACASVSTSGKFHYRWAGGTSKCIKCGKQLHWYKTRYCRSCWHQVQSSGEHYYYTGESKKIQHCIHCGKKINNHCWRTGKRGCPSCSAKIRSAEIPNKLILRPNQMELNLYKLLKSLFCDKYKYVGNGKFYIDRFNPDFIDKRSKKIIEFNGTYWHTKDAYVINKDKEKVEMYKKYGYNFLTIWQEELKDINKLRIKLQRFDKR